MPHELEPGAGDAVGLGLDRVEIAAVEREQLADRAVAALEPREFGLVGGRGGAQKLLHLRGIGVVDGVGRAADGGVELAQEGGRQLDGELVGRLAGEGDGGLVGDGGEPDEAEAVLGLLLVAGGDPAEPLERPEGLLPEAAAFAPRAVVPLGRLPRLRSA